MKYNKLIRDKIPEIIKKDGKTPITHIADREEYWEKLRLKLKEETEEFLQKSTKEELPDILEVIYAICDFLDFDKKDLEALREKKAKERGSFNKRVILDETK